VALGALGVIITAIMRSSAGSAAIGLVLSAAALAAATLPATSCVIAWMVCALTLAGGFSIELPTHLLAVVPLWATARYCRPAVVAMGGVGALAGGLMAIIYAADGNLRLDAWVPLFWSSERFFVPDSSAQTLAIGWSVWVVAAIALMAGLMGRWNETNRQARRAERATSEQSVLLAAQKAVAEERTRISREMHDIVAHSLSVMIAQADGGRYAGASDPAAALGALDAIAKTGRDALRDMRGIVRVLREGPDDQTMELRPAPHVRDLQDLITESRQAGLNVTLVRVGHPRYLPPGVGAALQRIAQEALTNAMKHAGPGAEVIVTERWQAERIELSISDDGRGAAAPNDGDGHGLLGMRERAEMLGGRLRAGPGPTGGFSVVADVPLPPASR
jgi:signal transduction histidine kinase